MPEEPESRTIARAHARWRRLGARRIVLYRVARVILTSILRLWFRLHVSGRDHVPAEGPAILAPNHKSFVDVFFVGLATRRQLRFMAKRELFGGLHGRLLARLGAFPVRRGEADEEALETARAVLADGGLVVVFPEGTRVDDPDVLGSPHHGAGRLAFETGAPIVPTAIAGTANLWLGPVPRPRRVHVAFLEPVVHADGPASREALAELIDDEVWPAVAEEYGRLAATPGPIIAALAALGVTGGLVARRLRSPQPPRIVGFVAPRRLRRAPSRTQRLRRALRGRRR